MYAPFGTGALIGPSAAFESGDPFLAGGGAVDLVDLDEVVWRGLPDREEAGSPNVLGAVALGAAAETLTTIGWERIRAHDETLAAALLDGLRAIDGVRVLGPGPQVERLPIAAFTIDGVPHALARSSRSAYGAAVSARTRTSSGCSDSAPANCAVSARLRAGTTDVRFPAPSARRRGSRPRSMRSSACLPRSTSSHTRRLELSTSAIRGPATTGRAA